MPERRGVRWVAKTDDDAFVHVPNLQAALEALDCHPRVSFGSHAFCGYNPTHFAKCGFDWGSNQAWLRYGCGGNGFYPAVAFALGQLQVLSADVVHRLVASADAAHFVARAEATINLPKRWATHRGEDVAFGFLLAQLQDERWRVSYMLTRTGETLVVLQGTSALSRCDATGP